MIWDILKYNRDKKNKEKTIVSAVEKELAQNISVLINNKDILEKELKLIDKQGKTIITSLSRLKNGFWDLVKIHLPKKYDNPDFLLKTNNVFTLTDILNDQIRNREAFKINNMALNNYNETVKIYDQLINKIIEELIDETSGLLEMSAHEESRTDKILKWFKIKE